MSSSPDQPGSSTSGSDYVVVARRYRPQSFSDLVGQQQVTQALSNAITTQRVGHAYLFTGARGVGKTSAARIFAKALNCVNGPTPTPCNECDICLGITAGGDVDVLEIDGASNRGIDEIRQLRSNVNIRPSRARFKIYTIDEVHMLTTQAFNALLKTLEEPPEHVKFIFCTTDPEKIPITVLSRCQRFDFAPVPTDSIVERLQQIVTAEQATADEEALRLLARRAAGSMRDSQSLLEQLLSFCDQQISVADVHAMLGTAGAARLADIVSHIVKRDAAGSLRALDVAVSEGVEVGQLAEQLVGYFRDMMAVAVGCELDLMLQTEASDFPALQEASTQFGVETMLAMVQILDQAIERMRQSTQARTLLDVAFVRLCQLDELESLEAVVAQLRSGQSLSAGAQQASPAAPSAPSTQPAPPEKKTEFREPAPISPPPASSGPPKSAPSSAEDMWKQTLAEFKDITADYGAAYETVAISAPNRLVVTFKAGYTLQKEGCERPERKARIEEVLQKLTGKSMRVDFEVASGSSAPAAPKRRPSLRQRMRETEKHEFVKQAAKLFDAEVTRLEDPRS